MSIFSDYECGAMSDSEFKQACARMNREERDQQYIYFPDPKLNREVQRRLKEKEEKTKMAKISNEKYEDLMRKGIKYDLLVSKIEQNLYISEYGLEGRIKADDEVVDLVAIFEPDFAEILAEMIADKKAEVEAKKAKEAEGEA
jgi:hypothetical protein